MRTVPYYAQWESPELVADIVGGRIRATDDPRWRNSGAGSPEEYEFWSWRSCGIACLRMILEHHGQTVPPAVVLARECEGIGGYVRNSDGVRGLIYAPFVEWVQRRFLLPAEARGELSHAQLRESVAAGDLVMASVHPTIREPTETAGGRGGHLVLVTAVADDAVVINNPSGFSAVNQQAATVHDEDFVRFYARRGIVFSRPV
jgi:hypothetical protein